MHAGSHFASHRHGALSLKSHHSIALLVWLCAWAASVSGCRMKGDYPAGTNVSCQRDSDCRTGFSCQPNLKLCRALGDIDRRAPTVEAGATLSLSPPPGLWLHATSMGPGATARVTFTASERLSDAALSVCPDLLSCVPERVLGSTWTFACDFLNQPPPPATTTCDVEYRLVDLAAFESTGTLPLALRIDTERPADPSVDTEDAVVLYRAPWGSQDAGLKSAMRVELAAVAEDEALLVWDSPTQASPSAAGGFGEALVNLAPQDRTRAWVQLVDQAGNVSGLRGVRDVTYVASLGDYGDNPQRFDVRGAHGDALFRRDALIKTARDGLASLDSGVVTTQGAWVWEEKEYLRFPYNAAPAYAWNPNTGRLTQYGGGLTLEWNGAYWVYPDVVDPEDDGEPTVHSNAAMAFDPTSDRMLMMGGRHDDGGVSDATWAWNGQSWKRVAQGAPGGRQGHAMTTDVQNRRVLLFGGRLSDGQVTGDLWEWAGAGWKLLDAGAGPAARAEHAMAYESSTGKTWLFFGDRAWGDAGFDLLSDVWSFDGRAWTPSPALSGNGPLARASHSAAYDTRADRLNIAGGFSSDGTRLGDLWVVRDGGWVRGANLPHLTANGAVAYDPARDRLVRWAGVGSGDGFGAIHTNVWNADGGWSFTWYPSVSLFGAVPSPRTNHALAYDEALGGIVMQGGELGPFKYDTTFLWRGVAMSQVVSALSPGRRTLHSMAYDKRLGGTVLFGGIGETGAVESNVGDGGTDYATDAGTWLLKNGEWQLLSLQSPPARFAHGTFFDSASNAVVVVGGSDLLPLSTGNVTLNGGLNGAFFDTWSLGASGTWVRGPDLPSPAAGIGAVFDSVKKTQVVVPGITPFVSFTGIYSRDVTQGLSAPWTSVVPMLAPPLLQVQNVVYDAARERVLMFGPPIQSRNNFTADRLWEWDGTSWSESVTSDPEGAVGPGELAGVRMAYFPGRERTFLFGGTTIDAWEVDSAGRRPSHVFSMSLDAAKLPTGAQVRSLFVTAHSGASGAARDAGTWVAQDGFSILPFIDGAFGAPLASSASPSAAPAALVGQVPEAFMTRAVKGQKRFSVALVPQGVNGNRTATLATDYLEATLKYRQEEAP